MSNLFNNMYDTLPIDIAFISQQITPIDLAETDNHITELDDILIDSELFKQIFYPHGENFGIDTTILSNPNVLNYTSFMSPHRTLNGGSKNFSLLELIISNIETDLNANRNCFKTGTLIELSKELSNIKTLCDIHSRCVECSLPWSNVLSIIKDNYINRDKSLPLKQALLIISVVFKSPNPHILPTIIKFKYRMNIQNEWLL
jgi:hypothetical protein